MDGHELATGAGDSGLNAHTVSEWDRYAAWPKGLARLALALLALFIVLAAWAPGMPAKPSEVPSVHPPIAAAVSGASSVIATPGDDGKDNDLRLYRLVTERVKRGDNYYVAATESQRDNAYPVAPGLTVRLPTLAFAAAFLGPMGVAVVELILLAVVLMAMHRRFSAEPGGEAFRLFGVVLLFVGLATSTHPSYLVLHEVWAAKLPIGLFHPVQPKSARITAGPAMIAGSILRLLELITLYKKPCNPPSTSHDGEIGSPGLICASARWTWIVSATANTATSSAQAAPSRQRRCQSAHATISRTNGRAVSRTASAAAAAISAPSHFPCAGRWSANDSAINSAAQTSCSTR